MGRSQIAQPLVVRGNPPPKLDGHGLGGRSRRQQSWGHVCASRLRTVPATVSTRYAAGFVTGRFALLRGSSEWQVDKSSTRAITNKGVKRESFEGVAWWDMICRCIYRRRRHMPGSIESAGPATWRDRQVGHHNWRLTAFNRRICLALHIEDETIRSWPCYIASNNGGSIPDRKPSPSNHCIRPDGMPVTSKVKLPS